MPNFNSFHIAFTETDSHWQFSVTDNGIGIKEDYFEKIFVVFNRLHTRESYSDAGIGLATTKKIVKHVWGCKLARVERRQRQYISLQHYKRQHSRN